MSVLFWVALLGALAGAVAWWIGRRKVRTTVQGLGAGLFAACVSGGVFDVLGNSIQDEESAKRHDDVVRSIDVLRGARPPKERDLIEALTPLCGRKEDLAREVVRHILTDQIFYSNFAIDDTVAYISEDTGPRALVGVTGIHRFTIHNPTEQSQTVPVPILFFNLATPPTPEAHLMHMSQVQFQPFDAQGVAKEVVRYEPSSLNATSDAEKRTYNAPILITIGAGESGTLSFRIKAWEWMTNGSIAVATARKTINMSMAVTFPDARLKPDVQVRHPEAGTARITGGYDGRRRVEKRIQGAVLPYQGLTVTWSPIE